MNCLDQTIGDRFALYHGDSCEVLRGLPDKSVHFSVFSPPFAWTLYDGSTDDGFNVIAPSGGPGSGRWKRARSNDMGANLTDAAATIYVSGNRTRLLPASTLTTNRSLTLGTTGAVSGDELIIVRNDATAFTYTIVNGGSGAGNVAVMPISNRAWCRARFDGTNWIHIGSAIALASS
jgi:hypothetical protein